MFNHYYRNDLCQHLDGQARRHASSLRNQIKLVERGPANVNNNKYVVKGLTRTCY